MWEEGERLGGGVCEDRMQSIEIGAGEWLGGGFWSLSSWIMKGACWVLARERLIPVEVGSGRPGGGFEDILQWIVMGMEEKSGLVSECKAQLIVLGKVRRVGVGFEDRAQRIVMIGVGNVGEGFGGRVKSTIFCGVGDFEGQGGRGRRLGALV